MPNSPSHHQCTRLNNWLAFCMIGSNSPLYLVPKQISNADLLLWTHLPTFRRLKQCAAYNQLATFIVWDLFYCFANLCWSHQIKFPHNQSPSNRAGCIPDCVLNCCLLSFQDFCLSLIFSRSHSIFPFFIQRREMIANELQAWGAERSVNMAQVFSKTNTLKWSSNKWK